MSLTAYTVGHPAEYGDRIFGRMTGESIQEKNHELQSGSIQ